VVGLVHSGIHSNGRLSNQSFVKADRWANLCVGSESGGRSGIRVVVQAFGWWFRQSGGGSGSQVVVQAVRW